MGSKTGIAWTDSTWNWSRGCSKRVETVVRGGKQVKVTSPACLNCYAARVAAHPRLGGQGKAYEGLAIIQGTKAEWTGQIRVAASHMHDPLKWKTARRIFVNSMSDIFHPKMPWDIVDDALYIMQKAARHEYQVLTKYTDQMLAYAHSEEYRLELMRRNTHILWGVSTENQEMFDVRLANVSQLGLHTLWLSMEPLLGFVTMAKYMRHRYNSNPRMPGLCEDCGQGIHYAMHARDAESVIKWVVVGGESGDRKRIRPTDHEWYRWVRDQAKYAGTPFFQKQLCELEGPDFANMDSFPEDLRIQEWPERIVPSGAVETEIPATA